jgi:hypothetical protein
MRGQLSAVVADGYQRLLAGCDENTQVASHPTAGDRSIDNQRVRSHQYNVHPNARPSASTSETKAKPRALAGHWRACRLPRYFERQLQNVAPVIPCLQHNSIAGMLARRSFSTLMICSSPDRPLRTRSASPYQRFLSTPFAIVRSLRTNEGTLTAIGWLREGNIETICGSGIRTQLRSKNGRTQSARSSLVSEVVNDGCLFNNAWHWLSGRWLINIYVFLRAGITRGKSHDTHYRNSPRSP